MQLPQIAIIGGTGPQGKGLGYRFARAGYPVTLGSRSADRAQEAAAELRGVLPADAVVAGDSNGAAASAAAVVLVAVPFKGYRDLLVELAEHLAGKTVITCVNPLGFDKSGPYGRSVEEGSAAEMAAAVVPTAHVVSAFHHLSAVNLLRNDASTGEDVLVCGDDDQSKTLVRDLAIAVVGRRGIDAGPLRLSRHLEHFTAVLISINKRYKAHSGVAISGLPSVDAS